MAEQKSSISMTKLVIWFCAFIFVVIIGTVIAVLIAKKNQPKPQIKKHSLVVSAVASPMDAQPIVTPNILENEQPNPIAASSLQPQAASSAITEPSITPTQQSPALVSGSNDAKKIDYLVNTMSQMVSRISALEARIDGRVKPSVITQKIIANQVSRTSMRAKNTLHASSPLESQDKKAEQSNVTDLSGYKVEGVVGKRSFISLPDGSFASVSPGETLPAPRVKSVERETGVVITNNHKRIAP